MVLYITFNWLSVRLRDAQLSIGFDIMSNITNEDVLRSLGNLTIPELVALTKTLEEKWDVKALPQVVEVQKVEPPPVVKTEFTVMLMSVSVAAKMNTIKAVR